MKITINAFFTNIDIVVVVVVVTSATDATDATAIAASLASRDFKRLRKNKKFINLGKNIFANAYDGLFSILF